MNLKTFGKNTLIYFIGEIALRFISFALIPLYTRYLSQSDFGLLITAFATVELMVIFMRMEMTPSFIRYYKEFEANNTLGHLFGTSLLIILLGCILIGSVSVIILPNYFYLLFKGKNVFTFLIFICSLGSSKAIYIHIISFYRANNNALAYAVPNIIAASLILFVSSFVLVVLGKGVNMLILGHALSYALIGIVVFIKISRNLKPSFSVSTISPLFRFGLPLIFSASAWFVLEMSDRYFLAYFRGLEDVAIYGLGYKIASILLFTVVSPFQKAYGPFVYEIMGQSDAKQKLARIFFYLISSLFLAAIGISIASPMLLKIIAPHEYRNSYFVILSILPVGIITGIFYWASTLIHIVKKTYVISIVMIISMTMNLILNYFLIPKFGWPGAALSTNISFLFATFCIYFLGMWFFPVPILSESLYSCKAIVKVLRTFYKRCHTKLYTYN